MRMSGNKLNEEEMKNVSGGTGAAEAKFSDLENYPTEQKACPVCGSNKLVYKTFVASDGVTTKIGQACDAGHQWTFGTKTGIKN